MTHENMFLKEHSTWAWLSWLITHNVKLFFAVTERDLIRLKDTIGAHLYEWSGKGSKLDYTMLQIKKSVEAHGRNAFGRPLARCITALGDHLNLPKEKIGQMYAVANHLWHLNLGYYPKESYLWFRFLEEAKTMQHLFDMIDFTAGAAALENTQVSLARAGVNVQELAKMSLDDADVFLWKLREAPDDWQNHTTQQG